MGTEDFVTHEVLKDYIQDTAIKTGVHKLTRYNTEVKNILKKNGKWVIDTVTLESGESGESVRNQSKSVSA